MQESRNQHGSNVMTRKKKKSFFSKFISNLGDPVIKVLIIALVVNLIFTFRDADWFETAGIAASVFLATLISTLSEHGSESAFEKLKRVSDRQKVRVLRDGELCEIDISSVVVGDILYVGAGEQIAADGFLLSGGLSVDQSSMTGESREVYKRIFRDGDERSPASSSYCLRGCTVVSGEGMISVDRVGDATFLGSISHDIQEETRESPLKVRLSRLAKQISTFGYIAAVLVSFAYLFNVFVVGSAFDPEIIRYKFVDLGFLSNHFFHALTLGLTVVVMAVPEGLPMMIAVVLSSNIRKMVKDNVLVRKGAGIEAAGSMNILFTDKTGTLTEGKLMLGSIYLGDGKKIESLSNLSRYKLLYESFCTNVIINNSATLGRTENRSIAAMGGNSTDRALLSALVHYSKENRDVTVIGKIPFDSQRKYSLAIINEARGKRVLVKGAPEKIFPYVGSYLDTDGVERTFDASSAEELCKGLSYEGKRLLAIAEAYMNIEMHSLDNLGEAKLRLVAIVVLEDKVRKGARDSVNKLRGAGIHVVMITGDNHDTASYIAKKCGIIDSTTDIVLTSRELAQLSDVKLKEILPRLAVVARALPTDKSRLVRVSQELDMVVGMTGDGINDAPALKRADVGFSMGSGTDVAKDAGDIIILDDDLRSIVKAVLYGRNIFKSIRKFISLQLTMNLCACGVSMICPFIGFESPVTVVQMLWINIIMDTLGGLAFAGEPALLSCMNEKPKRRDEPILNGYMVNEILLSGSFTVGLCIALLKMPAISSTFRYSPDNIYLLTAFFALFIFASVFNCFNARSDRINLFSNVTRNRWFIVIMVAILIIQILFVYLGGRVLRTAPLTYSELLLTLLLAMTVFPADILRKLVWRLLFGKKGY